MVTPARAVLLAGVSLAVIFGWLIARPPHADVGVRPSATSRPAAAPQVAAPRPAGAGFDSEAANARVVTYPGSPSLNGGADGSSPLAPERLQAMFHYFESRGYGRSGLALNADGSINLNAPNSDPYGLDGLADQVLRSRAEGGDPDAQFVLAGRLLEGGVRKLPPAKVTEAAELLRSSAVSGSTASLAVLSQLERSRSIAARSDARNQHLVDAHAWQLVAARRGDLEAIHAGATMLPALGDEASIVAASTRAQQIYSQLAAERQARGLPPFDDELPDSIRATYSAMVADIDRQLLTLQVGDGQTKP